MKTSREEQLEAALRLVYKTVTKERKPLHAPSVIKMIDRVRGIYKRAMKDA